MLFINKHDRQFMCASKQTLNGIVFCSIMLTTQLFPDNADAVFNNVPLILLLLDFPLVLKQVAPGWQFNLFSK